MTKSKPDYLRKLPPKPWLCRLGLHAYRRDVDLRTPYILLTCKRCGWGLVVPKDGSG